MWDWLPLLSTDSGRWAAAVLVLADVLAFTSIWHSHVHSTKTKVLWTAIVALLPVAGALGWVALGRQRRGLRVRD